MRTSAHLLFVAFAALGAPPALLQAQSPRAAQSGERERWQISLDNGGMLWDVRLVKLSGDSLSVTRPDSLATVSLKHVTELRLIKKSEVQLGTAGGAFNALVGGDDEVYDLTPLEFADRVKAVQKIFLYHPPEGTAPNN
jgi:hypothetical protein